MLIPPIQPWQYLSADFVIGLHLDSVFNAVLLVTDSLTKERYYVLCFAGNKGTSVERTVDLLVQHVFRLHGLFDTIVSDRRPQLIAEMWNHFLRMLQIGGHKSASNHLDYGRQTENAEAEMERYLRAYVNHQQDDWVKWL